MSQSPSNPAMEASTRKSSWLPAILFAAVLVLGTLQAGPASAGDHDPKDSGHPLRVIAYILHPVGVVADTLVVRPLHWVVHREPLKTLFGHTD